MTSETEKNEGKGCFSAELRLLATRYRIRGIAIARELGVTPQYVSKLLTAKNLPTPFQLKKVLAMLKNAGAGDDEKIRLANSFIRDKTGFLPDDTGLEFNAHDALERRLLADFRQLNTEQQREVLKGIAGMIVQNIQDTGL